MRIKTLINGYITPLQVSRLEAAIRTLEGMKADSDSLRLIRGVAEIHATDPQVLAILYTGAACLGLGRCNRRYALDKILKVADRSLTVAEVMERSGIKVDIPYTDNSMEKLGNFLGK